jgi:hypothetical protein
MDAKILKGDQVAINTPVNTIVLTFHFQFSQVVTLASITTGLESPKKLTVTLFSRSPCPRSSPACHAVKGSLRLLTVFFWREARRNLENDVPMRLKSILIKLWRSRSPQLVSASQPLTPWHI